ncbi:Murein hydrolase activator EnvC [Methylomonas albis]|uniref:Peptidoglycan DD-metalloendopeptidase family protein n=1 Tax=Methylomonas albis TaxID=1854563 RepID=A0ABR9CWZ5_9GAMM|nr:peptidoglycan DD-metalloendopeptidase family protein [Methylomonas albis]CAD6877369.1 Murein hydrolase activator EnvC [Methylomonas albis]
MQVDSYFLFACLAIGWALPVKGDTEKARRLVEVQSQIQQVGDDVKSLAVEKSRLLEQLQKLERQYGELANGLRAIKAEIKQQEQALQDVRNKSVATQKDMRSQEKELEGLIKAIYAMGGDKEGLKVILNQHNPAVSSRMLVYYDYVSKARLQKLEAMAEDFKVLRQLEAQKDTETQLLQVSLEKKQQETEVMQTLRKQREVLLASIEQDYASKSVQMAGLMHDEKKLQALVASLQKTDDNEAHEPTVEPELVLEKHEKPAEQPEPPKKTEVNLVREPAGLSFAELQGKLPWPVQGAITDRFGSRRYETTWDGVVISAREGADIHAVTAGRVVYADWLRGYGLMIIVDHGKGYMSLYAFNQSLHKNVGEHVRAGETLASVGRSGGRADAALYFGIRKKGRPINPEQWCRKPAKG